MAEYLVSLIQKMAKTFAKSSSKKDMQLNTTAVKNQKYGEIINMNISQEGLSLIKKFEGCELEAYKCAAGVWTIGYGSTKGVKEGDNISQEEADKLLLHEMEEYEGYIKDAVTVDLSKTSLML